MKNRKFDLVVVGAGSGGVRAARTAAKLGAKVAVIEERYLGGTCVNVGCVPKKLMVFASDYQEHLKAAQSYGWNLEGPRFDWQTLRDNVADQVDKLNEIYQGLIEDSGVELFWGKGELLNSTTVKVSPSSSVPGGQNDSQAVEIKADKIILATGGWPNKGDFEGAEHCVTSNEIFSLEAFPQRILILGGGYIAAEFSCIFSGLGSEVNLVFRNDRILKSFDEDVTRHVMEEMSQAGIQLHGKESIEKIEKTDDGFRVSLLSGKTLVVDQVLAAIGRHPKTDGLGLEKTIVIPEPSGHIKVDKTFKTNEASIYAIGDLVGNLDLTPVALNEGMYLARHLYDESFDLKAIDYDKVATAIFTRPNIGVLGMTEAAARKAFDEIEVYQSTFRPLKTAFAKSDARCMMKIIVRKRDDEVVGIHIACPEAGEIIQGFAALFQRGITKAELDRTVGIHPTIAEELVTMREARE